jgi:SAM-dependent methyltransferase
MDAKALYDRRLQGGFVGWAARVLSFVYLRVRPPAAYDEHDTELRVFTEHVKTAGRVLLLGSNLAPDVLKRRGYSDVVQLDVKQYENVDVVADAETMSATLPAASFDFIVSTSMIEHTRHPWRVFTEAFTLLDIGGILYVDAPWMYPLHGEPQDYFRFSEACLRNLVEEAGFEILGSGANVSGHGALATFLPSYLSEALSFDRSVLYHGWRYIFGWALFPLGYIERLFSLKNRKHRYTDSIVYVVGRRPESSRPT